MIAKSIILTAISTGQLPELLSGQKGYALPNPYFDTPTEPMQVFKAYVATFGEDPARMQEFARAVVTLSKDPQFSWFSAYYLMDILDNPALFGQDFDFQGLVNEVLGNVKRQKDSLSHLKQWAGAQDPEGCWGIVDRFVGQLKKYNETPDLKIEW